MLKTRLNVDITYEKSSNTGGSSRDVNIENKNLLPAKINRKPAKSKKIDFAKAISSKTDFFTPKTKATFIHLQKALNKAPILHYFDSDHHIESKTNTFSWGMLLVESSIR